MTSAVRDIPDSVLDEAFQWAVVLSSGTVDSSQRREFERWLLAPLHRTAWQRIEIIDQEFAALRSSGSRSRQALDRVAAQRRHRNKLKSLAGTLLLLPLAAFLLLPSWHAQHMTHRTELKTITLAGGARVYLDDDTALDLEQVSNTTLLQLHRGRILVDSSAAEPADKPQVAAAHGHFTPVGTRFVVTARDDEADLAVLEGRVRTEADAGKPREARAGEHLRVTGVFHIDDTDAALQQLERSLPLAIKRSNDWWISVQAKGQQK